MYFHCDDGKYLRKTFLLISRCKAFVWKNKLKYNYISFLFDMLKSESHTNERRLHSAVGSENVFSKMFVAGKKIRVCLANFP